MLVEAGAVQLIITNWISLRHITMVEAALVVLVTGVEAVEVLHQLLPLKIMACCYDNKNMNTAWPTIPDHDQIFWIMTTLPPSMNTVSQQPTPTTNPTRLSECATENSFALPFLFTILRLWTRLWPRRLHQTQPQHIIGPQSITQCVDPLNVMGSKFRVRVRMRTLVAPGMSLVVKQPVQVGRKGLRNLTQPCEAENG